MQLRDRLFIIDSGASVNRLRRYLHSKGEPLYRDIKSDYPDNLFDGFLLGFKKGNWSIIGLGSQHTGHKCLTDIREYLNAGLSPCRLP